MCLFLTITSPDFSRWEEFNFHAETFFYLMSVTSCYIYFKTIVFYSFATCDQWRSPVNSSEPSSWGGRWELSGDPMSGQAL